MCHVKYFTPPSFQESAVRFRVWVRFRFAELFACYLVCLMITSCLSHVRSFSVPCFFQLSVVDLAAGGQRVDRGLGGLDGERK